MDEHYKFINPYYYMNLFKKRKERKMEKEKYTTSEAADKLEVAPSTLRYWEKELSNYINISRNEHGHRQYTPEDIEQLKKIKNYLYRQNYSIKQVREILNLEDNKQEIAATLSGEKNESINSLLSILIDKIDNIEQGIEDIKSGQHNLKSDYLQSLKLIKARAEERDQKLIKEIRKRLADKEDKQSFLEKLLPWKKD